MNLPFRNEDDSRRNISPQKGPQERFLASSADIAIFGGAAGGGKTYSLLLEPLRHSNNPQFGGVIFRQQSVQIMNEGGLWDTSFDIYGLLSAIPKLSPHPQWDFASGSSINFHHLNADKDVLSWQGSQIPFIGYDELTHFSQNQFWYMLSRNRSMSGVRPYIRATTNPDVDSWVANLISWWIDQETGYPIPARSGILRWFVRFDDKIHWAAYPQELYASFPGSRPKSLTFIPSKLTDNLILMQTNPDYMANLLALGRVERERLLNGNWKIRPQTGSYFPRTKVSVLPAIPSDIKSWIRRWDLAATEISEVSPSPSATAGVLMGCRENGKFVVADGISVRKNADEVRKLIKNMASHDKEYHKRVVTVIPQDPGQAGKDQAESLIRYLSGYVVRSVRETGNKETRAEPFSAQWQAGNVEIVSGPWNKDYFSEMEGFPQADHDDYVDASSGSFLACVNGVNAIDRWRALSY